MGHNNEAESRQCWYQTIKFRKRFIMFATDAKAAYSVLDYGTPSGFDNCSEVPNLGVRVQNLWFLVSGLGFLVSDFWFLVSGLRFLV